MSSLIENTCEGDQCTPIPSYRGNGTPGINLARNNSIQPEFVKLSKEDPASAKMTNMALELPRAGTKYLKRDSIPHKQ